MYVVAPAQIRAVNPAAINPTGPRSTNANRRHMTGAQKTIDATPIGGTTLNASIVNGNGNVTFVNP